ncbi:MAG: hypothetical protein MJ252_29780 [archaeon]|nr:hypothetical protein [archaeon]
MDKNANLQNQIQTNANLKLQLMNISNQIEASLRNSKESQEVMINDDINENERKTNKKFLTDLEGYKKSISELQKLVDNSANFKEIEYKENQIKFQSQKLKELRKEYETSMNIIKKQQESLEEIDNQMNAKSEINSFKQKLQIVKDETKVVKDSNLNYLKVIKDQNKQILLLDDQCKLINDNIEIKKKNINFDNIINNQQTEKKLEGLIQKKLKNSKLKTSNYEKEIKNQEKKIASLSQEIEILKVQLKYKKKQIYITEEKMKQIKNYQKEMEKSQSPKRDQTQGTNGRYSAERNTGDNRYNDRSQQLINRIPSTDCKRTPFIIKSFTKGSNQKQSVNIKEGAKKRKPDFTSPDKIRINNELEQLSKKYFLIF